MISQQDHLLTPTFHQWGLGEISRDGLHPGGYRLIRRVDRVDSLAGRRIDVGVVDEELRLDADRHFLWKGEEYTPPELLRCEQAVFSAHPHTKEPGAGTDADSPPWCPPTGQDCSFGWTVTHKKGLQMDSQRMPLQITNERLSQP